MKNKLYLVILILVIIFTPISYIKASSSSSIDSQIRYLKSQISLLEIDKKQAMDNQRETLAHMGALLRDGGSDDIINKAGQRYQIQIDLLEEEIENLKELKKINQEEEDSINEAHDNLNNEIDEIEKNYKNKEVYNLACLDIYGDKAFYDPATDKCTCNDGYYINKNNKCATLQSICVEREGKNGFALNGKCFTCDDGYKYDKSSGMCALVKKEMKTIPVIEKDTKKDLSYESFINEKSNIDSESVKKTNQSNNSITNKVVKFFKKILFWGSKN